MPQIRIYVKNAVWEEVVQQAGGSPKQAVRNISRLVEMAYEQKKATIG